METNTAIHAMANDGGRQSFVFDKNKALGSAFAWMDIPEDPPGSNNAPMEETVYTPDGFSACQEVLSGLDDETEHILDMLRNGIAF